MACNPRPLNGCSESQRVAETFGTFFGDVEMGRFIAFKLLPPVEKLEVAKDRFTLRFKRQYEGKIEKIEPGGNDSMVGVSLVVGPILKGCFDFANRKCILDSKEGLYGKKGMFRLDLKELELTQTKQVILRSNHWLVPSYAAPYEQIKNTLHFIRWAELHLP
jgi:hypothetical protein